MEASKNISTDLTADYPDELSAGEALQIYFSKYHFADGGYDLKWFKIHLGFFYIPLPNIKARVEAVKIHDLHHLITGYPATLRGEAEIGAWELASGCGSYSVGWILNGGSFFYGLFFFPVPLFRAFMRGRTAFTNLYYNTVYDEKLLASTVGALRNYVQVNGSRNNNLMDILRFAGLAVLLLSVVMIASYVACIALHFFVKLYK